MLEMQNISKHFGAVKALEEVDFGLEKAASSSLCQRICTELELCI